MTPKQNEKYGVNVKGRIYNRHTLREIPQDEPLFILRASDLHALSTVQFYANECGDPTQRQICQQIALRFATWRNAHPEAMKEPGPPYVPPPTPPPADPEGGEI